MLNPHLTISARWDDSLKSIARDQPLDCSAIAHSLGGADKRTAESRPDLFMSRSVRPLLAIAQAIAQLWDEPSAALGATEATREPHTLGIAFRCGRPGSWLKQTT